MGALTETYVATTSGDDATGDGSSGNPFQTVQHVLDNVTRDTTNGDKIFVSGEDVLSASLDFTTWGSPTLTAKTVLRNWVGGPDGAGGLDGNNGNFALWNKNHVSAIGLNLHNTGTEKIVIVDGDGRNYFQDCVFFDNSNGWALDNNGGANHGGVFGCSFSNCGGVALHANVFGSWFFEGPTNTFSNGMAIRAAESNRTIWGNIITLKASSANDGIQCFGGNANIIIAHNSILSSSGTGKGIYFDTNGSVVVFNNLIEGFSGTGGIGISLNDWTTTMDNWAVANNAVFNCATAYDLDSDTVFTDDNESLGSTPFAKSGSNTFANRFVYFAPLDVDNVWGGAYPGGNLDKGAVQHVSSGGGLNYPRSMSGGLV
jgi:hypothetical protein